MSEKKAADELRTMVNIGAVLAGQLREVGIDTPARLREVGSREAWLRIRQMDPSACLSRLRGLEGAIRGVRWHALPPEVKEELRVFYIEQTAR